MRKHGHDPGAGATGVVTPLGASAKTAGDGEVAATVAIEVVGELSMAGNDLMPDLPAEHWAAIQKAGDLFRLFLATRPIDEARTVGKHLKQMILSEPDASARGWIIGVRRTNACAVLSGADEKGGE